MELSGVRVLGPAGLSAPSNVILPVAGEPDLDASGLVLSPGWIDLHAHLRDPGAPHKETLETGAAAAAAGGFTHVVAMANTEPPTETAEQVRRQVDRARHVPARISFAAAATMRLEGRTPTDPRALKAAGAVALSDDGRHAMDVTTLEAVLRRAAGADLPVFIHAQLDRLAGNRLAIPKDAEVEAVREALVALRRTPGARLHLQHISTAEAVDLVAAAKGQGLEVTAEVTPHHLVLTADEVARSGAAAVVNPPLRSGRDVAAVREALEERVIDVVATDHAPHEEAVKRELATAAFGISGLDTTLAVMLSLGLPWPLIHRACVAGPAAILRRALPADDWVLIDPAAEWTVDPASFRSRGRNTPWAGRRLRGRVRLTVVRGRVVYRDRVVSRV